MRLQRGYMVQSQFDSRGSASESTPLTYNTPPPARSKAVYQLANTDADDSFDPQPVNRANTNESHLSASTLVAEHGSVMTQASRNLKVSGFYSPSFFAAHSVCLLAAPSRSTRRAK
jgi:hypothetical protein